MKAFLGIDSAFGFGIDEILMKPHSYIWWDCSELNAIFIYFMDRVGGQCKII